MVQITEDVSPGAIQGMRVAHVNETDPASDPGAPARLAHGYKISGYFADFGSPQDLSCGKHAAAFDPAWR